MSDQAPEHKPSDGYEHFQQLLAAREADAGSEPTSDAQATLEEFATSAPDAEAEEAQPEGGLEARPEGETDDGAADTDEASGSDEPSAAEVEKASAFLTLKGFGKELQAKLSAQDLVSMRDGLKSELAELERVKAERGQLRTRLEELERRPEGEELQQQQPAPSLDLDKLTEALSKHHGEDAATDVASALEGVVAPIVEQAQRAMAEAERVTKHAAAQAIASARATVGSEFPALSDPEVYESVMSLATALATSPQFKSLSESERMPALLRAAARAQGLNEVGAEEAESAAKKRPSSNGHPTTSSRRKPPQELTATERSRLLLQGLLKHRSDPDRVTLAQKYAGIGPG